MRDRVLVVQITLDHDTLHYKDVICSSPKGCKNFASSKSHALYVCLELLKDRCARICVKEVNILCIDMQGDGASRTRLRTWIKASHHIFVCGSQMHLQFVSKVLYYLNGSSKRGPILTI